MNVHCPVLLGENILGLGVVTVRLAESRFVCMGRVAGDGLGGDAAMVVRVAGVGQAEVTANGAALGPPEAGLAPASLLPGRAQLTGSIVGAGAARGLAAPILESLHYSVKCILTGWDTANIFSCPCKLGMNPETFGC